ncbi:MAG: hypothetical protein KTR28_04535 [Micavibrio sp.]|nr:hypothetical protein [Micavibrio sp.]
MDWQSLLDQDIKNFISAHSDDDVRALALKKPPSVDWDYPLVLDQIKARQKAAKKMPTWAAQKDVLFPRSDLIEQASSEACAKFKAGIFKAQSFADLTGGAGVDSVAFSAYAERGISVEMDQASAQLLHHNFRVLAPKKIEAVHARAEEFIVDMGAVDLAYIDPQRRDFKIKGKFRFEDCSPDIIGIKEDLLRKAWRVMVKASPMLDISAGVLALGNIEAVYAVEWGGDCKELLFIMSADAPSEPEIHAVKIDDEGGVSHHFNFTFEKERAISIEYAMPQKYLYEPWPAFQKAGGMKALAKEYGVCKLAEHTHLYTSSHVVESFPGRIFEIMGQYPVKAGALPVKKGNLTIRNFPMRTDDLRKKLKLKDGGANYIFACTQCDEKTILLHCQAYIP